MMWLRIWPIGIFEKRLRRVTDSIEVATRLAAPGLSLNPRSPYSAGIANSIVERRAGSPIASMAVMRPSSIWN